MSSITLRPYQSASIEALRQGFRDQHKRQVLCASTGAGKTVIMGAMIRAAVEKGRRVMVICERRVLIDQMSRHLDKAGIDHGVIMAGHWRFRPDRQIQVASAQTLERMETLPKVDMIFIDEVHACMRASIVRLIEAQPNLKIVGSTATPFNPLLGKHFTSVVNVITMRELVDQGYLVPYRVFVAKEIDTKGVKVVAGEWQKDELETRGRQIVGDIVADYVRISHDVFGEYRKTICFAAGIAHGAELAASFNAVGVNAVQISAEDTEEFKQDVLREFAKPDTPVRVLISVSILSRGFDQSDVDHVILARPLKKSFSEHVQQIGRGARPHEGKEFACIQDHSGNWLRFASEWEELYGDGVQELNQGQDAKPKKEPSQEAKEAVCCPKCKMVMGGARVCLNCGHERPRHNMVESVAGVMEEIGKSESTKKEKHSPEQKANFYAELLGYAEMKGFKNGWAYWKYRDRMGVGPSMSKPQPAPPSAATLGWITSQNIKRAKSKGAAA